MQIEWTEDSDSLASRCAHWLVDALRQKLSRRETVSLALSGGSTPKSLFACLSSEHAESLDWSRVRFLFVDERIVPPDDPRSNYRLARETLFDPLKIPDENVFPMVESRDNLTASPESFAQRYETVLRKVTGDRGIEILLLGLGDDGHTASLFPGKPALNSEDFVTWSEPGVLPPPVNRVTLTFRAINAAENVAFLVSGGAKREVVAKLVAGGLSRDVFPAGGVEPSADLWLFATQDSLAYCDIEEEG